MTTELQHTQCVKLKVWGVYSHRLTSRWDI